MNEARTYHVYLPPSYQNIAGHQRDDFIVEKRYFENETHGTVALLSWYYGLKHILCKREKNDPQGGD